MTSNTRGRVAGSLAIFKAQLRSFRSNISRTCRRVLAFVLGRFARLGRFVVFSCLSAVGVRSKQPFSRLSRGVSVGSVALVGYAPVVSIFSIRS